MAYVFDHILKKGSRAGQAPAKNAQSRKWFRDQAKRFSSPSAPKLMKNNETRMTDTLETGSMYFFFYDAKHKATLPFWDRFPLIFPIAAETGSFLGINLHYLPYGFRARLMDALYTISNNKRYDETTRLKISYDTLKAASKFKFFKPCVKRYLNTHVRSRFLKVDAKEWDIALFLEVQRWQGAKTEEVWADSIKKIKG